MATRSGFFNSVNGDRRYLAGNFAEYFATFIGNGVFPNPSSGLQVVANNNLSVNVSAGKGWINGYYFINDSDAPFTLDVADGVLKRIDRVVFRLDFATRAISLALKKGTFSAAPVAPTLQRDADIYELALADITVNNGVTAISQANITDQRMNSAVCGIVQGTVNQVDTTTIYNQYEAWFQQTTNTSDLELENLRARQEQEFRNWFEGIMNILDGDTAGNLANEIMRVEGKLDEHIADYIKHPAVATATFSNNQYTVNIEVTPTILMEGMGVVFLAKNDSNGETTLKINSRTAYPILRPNGLPLTNIKANSYYAVRYSLVTRSFMLLGEGGEYGDATPSTVRKGVTFGTENGISTGTMPFLEDRFLNQVFYRNVVHPYAFTQRRLSGCITRNNRFFIHLFNNSIIKYDILNNTYLNLGGNAFGTVTNVFANDDGSRIFVVSGNRLSMYNGTSWSSIYNNASTQGHFACSNPLGTEVFVVNSSSRLVKIDTTTNIETNLSQNSVSSIDSGVAWTDDNCVWYVYDNVNYQKLRTSDGAVVKTVTIPQNSTFGISFNRNSKDDIEFMCVAVRTGNLYYLVSGKKDGTLEEVISYTSGITNFTTAVGGGTFCYRDTSNTLVFYKYANTPELYISLPVSVSYNTPYHISADSNYTNLGETFTTIVNYS